ncbi:MAG: choice-of-anchor L domain-containing protein [Flavobacteriales bacterium]
MNRTRSFFALPALASALCVNAQLTVQNTLTPAQLVSALLTGQGINVSNVTLNGQPGNTVNDQVASFNGANSNIGFTEGIILCTGKAIMAAGPNNNPSLQIAPANPWNQRDPDLDRLSGYAQSGVVALEFDFVPTGDSVSFRFIFGSEEYNEFVCTQYNDVFGFFLSGPGISGIYTNNAVNLGSVPNKPDIAVSVNTINSGSPGPGREASRCAARDPDWRANSIYYVNNPMPLPPPFPPPDTTTVQFNGFTVPLRARARVQCGETYHIKMIIANIFDSNRDSGVFIEGHSFSSSGSLTTQVTLPFNDPALTEGCGNATVTITRDGTANDATVDLAYGGTASSDVEGTPSTLVILPDRPPLRSASAPSPTAWPNPPSTCRSSPPTRAIAAIP